MGLTDVLDTVLDRTVGPGYSRIGYTLRRRWWPADPAPDALRGAVVAITGGNSGLGLATALGVARLGGAVRLLCRDAGRGATARDTIVRSVAGADVVVDECDVADPSSALTVAARLRSQLPALHGLVHNAGVLPPERTENADGHELTLATHVLGPHRLTRELRGLLAADAGARVVFMSSGGMYAQRLRIDDPEFRQGKYSGTAAYARTKRMQVALAQRWAAELETDPTTVHAMHPGWADTPGVTDSLPGFARLTAPVLRTPDQGADTAVWLLAADRPARVSGCFWQDRRPRPIDYLPFTRASDNDVEALWRFCEDATT